MELSQVYDSEESVSDNPVTQISACKRKVELIFTWQHESKETGPTSDQEPTNRSLTFTATEMKLPSNNNTTADTNEDKSKVYKDIVLSKLALVAGNVHKREFTEYAKKTTS